MRFLCDVHITIKLSKFLEQQGHQSEHINNILNNWHTQDRDIMSYVDAQKAILITKDQDFRNSYLLQKIPRKLIKINLGNISNEALLKLVEINIDYLAELDRNHSYFMVEINKDGRWVVTK